MFSAPASARSLTPARALVTARPSLTEIGMTGLEGDPAWQITFMNVPLAQSLQELSDKRIPCNKAGDEHELLNWSVPPSQRAGQIPQPSRHSTTKGEGTPARLRNGTILEIDLRA